MYQSELARQARDAVSMADYSAAAGAAWAQCAELAERHCFAHERQGSGSSSPTMKITVSNCSDHERRHDHRLISCQVSAQLTQKGSLLGAMAHSSNDQEPDPAPPSNDLRMASYSNNA